MNEYFQKAESSLKEYETLSEKFKILLKTAKNDLANIKSLSIIEQKSHELVIEVLGKTVKIQFSMVIPTSKIPLGQISAILIKNKGTAIESESTILSRWFDTLGNIRGSVINEFSTEHIEHQNYLKIFSYNVIYKLLSDGHMEPNINNG